MTYRRAPGPDVRAMLLSAMLAALVAAASQIAIPLWPVPVNLALLPILAAALALPRRLALSGVGLYLLMGAVGLPVFAGFRGGPASLLGPTGGYLVGYLLTCGAVSLLREKADTVPKRALACALGVLACYVPGTLWLAWVTGKPLAALLPAAVLPFLPGDALKCLAAALTAPALRRAAGLKRGNRQK